MTGSGTGTPVGIVTAYATVEQYRAVTGKTDLEADTQIEEDLLAISRYLDATLRRYFGQSAVARTLIVPRTSDTLWTPDLAEAPTSVKADEDEDGVCETAITGFEVHPLNAALEPEPRPYTRIHLPSWASRTLFLEGQRVEVTAIWGWPAVPLAVNRACIHLTAILRLETPRATRRIQELGETVEASPDAMSIVRKLTDAYQVVGYI